MEAICYGCRKRFVPEAPPCRVCPACRDEFDAWLRGALRPASAGDDDPLWRLYGKHKPATPPRGGD